MGRAVKANRFLLLSTLSILICFVIPTVPLYISIRATTVWGEAPLLFALTSPPGRGFRYPIRRYFPEVCKI